MLIHTNKKLVALMWVMGVDYQALCLAIVRKNYFDTIIYKC